MKVIPTKPHMVTFEDVVGIHQKIVNAANHSHAAFLVGQAIGSIGFPRSLHIRHITAREVQSLMTIGVSVVPHC